MTNSGIINENMGVLGTVNLKMLIIFTFISFSVTM